MAASLFRQVTLRAISAYLMFVLPLDIAHAGPPNDRRREPIPIEEHASIEARLTAQAMAAKADSTLAITHLEATQGTQDVGHTVPMLAGRGLYIRVFFDLGGNRQTVTLQLWLAS